MSDTPTMVFCRYCGQKLHVTALACPHCGAPQVANRQASAGDGIERSFGTSIALCLRKYAVFRGRAPRAEFWWFSLFTLLVNLPFSIVGVSLHSTRVEAIGDLLSLVFLLPSIAVGVRRLHDTDRSGWWMLLQFLPIIGWVVLFIWFCSSGTRGDNRFGPEDGIRI